MKFDGRVKLWSLGVKVPIRAIQFSGTVGFPSPHGGTLEQGLLPFLIGYNFGVNNLDRDLDEYEYRLVQWLNFLSHALSHHLLCSGNAIQALNSYLPMRDQVRNRTIAS